MDPDLPTANKSLHSTRTNYPKDRSYLTNKEREIQANRKLDNSEFKSKQISLKKTDNMSTIKHNFDKRSSEQNQIHRGTLNNSKEILLL